MAWRTGAAALAGLLTLTCVIPYIRDILGGDTRPQRMSWLVFAALSIAAAIAQYDASGWTSGVALTTGAAIGFGTVFVLSVRHGVGGRSRLDVLTIIALSAVLLIWSRTSNERLVLVLIILIEVPAIVATVTKSLRTPLSETRSTWILDAAAGVVALAAAPGAEFDVLAYPAFHTSANVAVVVAIALGQRRTAI